MASRLPTISLKAIHIPRRYLLPVMVGFLLLIALLVPNFWLAMGILGLLYILTVPLTGWLFLRARAAWERSEQSKMRN